MTRAPDMIPIVDAADMLGVSRQRVYKLIADGKLEAHRGADQLQYVPRSAIVERQAEARKAERRLTTPEIAETLGVSETTVRSWIHDGRLPAEKLRTPIGWTWTATATDVGRVRPPKRGRPLKVEE